MYLVPDIVGTFFAPVYWNFTRTLGVVFLLGLFGLFVCPTVTQAQVVISGNVYSDAGVTGMAAAKNIRVAIGTTTVGIYNASSSAGSGAWTVTIPSGHAIAAGTRIAAWIDGSPLTQGSVVTKALDASTTRSISGLNLYQNRVIVRHEATSATTTTAEDFGFYSFLQDPDLQYVIGSSSDLRILPGNELYVWASSTFAPGVPVVVLGSASTTATDGSFYLAANAVFIASSTLTIGGSFTAVSTASITGIVSPIIFNATTTGKTISAPLANAGDMTFSGVGGAWTFTGSTTVTDLKILAGTVTAPSGVLSVTGSYINYATFVHNGGTLNILGPQSTTTADIAAYAVGRDISGSATGAGNVAVNNFVATGTYLYVANAGNATACSQVAGSAVGCELMVYDISSPTNPIYVAGRDAGGAAASTSAISINALAISGNFLYAVKGASNLACTQVVGTADGCEIMVFDISSTTNPVYVAGRDAGGDAVGVQTQNVGHLVIASSTLYIVKAGSATACSQTAGSAVGCEILAFSIASSTNPIYVAGRDASGNAAGTGNSTMTSLGVSRGTLYATKVNTAAACSQTAGSAVGCELMVFDISSSSNPVFVAGRDATGDGTGVGNIAMNWLSILDTSLFIAKAADATACSQTAGSAVGCELMVFDIASTSNPVYVAGRDAGGAAAGVQTLGINQVLAQGTALYVTKAASAIACDQRVGFGLGCELMVFDVSSSSIPAYIAGRDAGADTSGVQTLGATALAVTNNTLFVSKAGSASGCSQLAGSAIGCELMGFRVGTTPQGLLIGRLGGANFLNHVFASGTVQFLDNASTTNFTIGATATVTAPAILTIGGNYLNQSVIDANEGLIIMSSSTAQTLTGAMTGASSFYRLQFQGTGIKTFVNNASSTNIQIDSGATVVSPSVLSVTNTYVNNGTFSAASSTLQAAGYFGEFLAGQSVGASATDAQAVTANAFVTKGNFLYVGKATSVVACSQTAGSAVGCELLVYDISSSTNPAYRAGRDVKGDAGGNGGVTVFAMALSGNTLYLAKNGSATACSQTAGSADGCELMAFDISSSTNPVYVAGRDASGGTTGTTAVAVTQLEVVGNFLYVTKAANSLACTQVAGTADGCELMVFDISSTTNPVYVAGRDAGGDAVGVQSLAMQDVLAVDNTLYVVKVGSAISCSQTAGSAIGCELMVFDISSSTNPVYVAGRDGTGSAAGAVSNAAFILAAQNRTLYVGKTGSATACSQTAGSATGCELIAFDISSTTNPVYVAGRDMNGDSTGTGNATVNALVISGSQLTVAKTGSATACSQTAGSAIGCEVMVFDISSTTNPTYALGRDSTGSLAGRNANAVQTLAASGSTMFVGKVGDTTICEQSLGLTTGCEIMLYQSPTVLSGTLTGASALYDVVTVGQVVLAAPLASTTDVFIGNGSVFTAPTSSLTIAGDFTNNGTFVPGAGQVQLVGTSQLFSGATATTTFTHLVQQTTVAATTTFAPTAWVVTGNLTLQGTSTGILKLRSSSSTAQWKIDPWSSSTIAVAYLDVQNSNNIGATTTLITCSLGCVDSGNNSNWALGVQALISGILYGDGGVNPLTGGVYPLKLVVGGSVQTIIATTTNSGTGAYNFSIAQSLIATGTPLLLFVDGTTTLANTFTKASTSAPISGLSLHKNRLILRQEAVSGTSTTNADLSFYTSLNDSDVEYGISGGALTVQPGTELYLWTGDTFAPGGPVTILGNASAATVDGSVTLTAGSTYIAGGDTTLAGSLRASTSAAFTPATSTALVFTATTTGKVIDSISPTFGNVIFNGTGGAWSFTQSNATTTNFTINTGASVTAPSNNLNVTGTFSNYGSFTHNNGSLNSQGSFTNISAEVINYLAGRDAAAGSGSTGATDINAFATYNNFLFVGKSGNVSDCSQLAGSAIGCELMVFDISSTTNPVYVAGRDVSGDSTGFVSQTISALAISGSKLYVGKDGNATACSQTAGSATGCELMVFDISSTTNPVYVAGRDTSGSAAGTGSVNTTSLVISGNYLYFGKQSNATACSQASGAASGCELMSFDISSTTNLIYVAGRDTSGSAAGTGNISINALSIQGNYLYAVKNSDSTACSQVAGSAVGCELIVFNIASGANPVYAGGRDADTTAVGTNAVTFYSVATASSTLYVGKSGGGSTPCSANVFGCELFVFDISSSTNPLYLAGRDFSGSADGSQNGQFTALTVTGTTLYVGDGGHNPTPCAQVAGGTNGCEILIFDISSTTNPLYVAGRDANGSSVGTDYGVINALITVGDNLYVGKDADATACSQTAGSAVGCELMVFNPLLNNLSGVVQGNLTGVNSLNNFSGSGSVVVRDVAATKDFAIISGTTTAPSVLTVGGNYVNSAVFINNTGVVYASSSSSQNFSGTMTGSSAFNDVVMTGSGAKTFSSNASTSNFVINAGANVTAPVTLDVTGYTNNGAFTAGSGTLAISGGYVKEFLAGADSSGSATGTGNTFFYTMAIAGDYAYIAKSGSSTACSQSIGSADGCELMVFDISSSTNPVYVAGRDSDGSAAGVSSVSIQSIAIYGTKLYVGKSSNATACSQTAGSAIGCELLVFDISNPLNPQYVAGRDSSGSAAGTAINSVTSIVFSGNFIYVGKTGFGGACSQIAGSADGCEILVFDISSSTNPVYVAGRDSSGSAAGTASATGITSLVVVGQSLYVGKPAGVGACSQVAGSADPCELLVFDISSSTNPVYVAGRDSSGSATGSTVQSISNTTVLGNYLYVGKSTGSATACSQIAGSADGCEILVFDISSSTNPVYVAGRDSSGSAAGVSSVAVQIVKSNGSTLYVGKYSNATACSQTAGSAIGCELMVFDISNPLNPQYVAGRDSSGSATGTGSVLVVDLALAKGNLYVAKFNSATACSQISGSADGCEFMVFNAISDVTGNLNGISALNNFTVNTSARFNNSASTTNFVNNGYVLAPATALSLTNNFTNNGTFAHNNGEVILLGINQNITSVGTTTFYNLTQRATTSATTTFSNTGSFVTTGTLTLNGTTSAPLALRSVSPASPWTIVPFGPSPVSYLDVQDSRNGSSTAIVCSSSCIDSGNNTNWSFSSSSIIVGSSTLSNHVLGQVSNAFNFQNQSFATLLAFNLTPNSGNATVTDAVISITGAERITASDFTNIHLYRDTNNNAQYDGGDVAVGGAGVFILSGQSGTITFTDDFANATATNYILVSDWNAPVNGSFMNVSLLTQGLTIVDSVGTENVFGSVTSVQHNRNNKGAGGGSSAAIGGNAPVGDGDVGGGTSEAGDLIGDDPDYFWPSNQSGSWQNGANAYDRNDGTYATTSSAVNHTYQNFGFAIPNTNVITGIEMKLELAGILAAGTLGVQLSWDGGSSWTSLKTTPTLTTVDAVRTVGGPSDLWSRTWSASEFDNANFAIRVLWGGGGNTVRLDAIQMRVYHQSGGGGQGGGGGGGI